MGKTLFVTEKGTELERLTQASPSCKRNMSKSNHPKTIVVTVPVHGTFVDIDEVTESLLVFEDNLDAVFPRIYHFDIAPTVSIFYSFLFLHECTYTYFSSTLKFHFV